MKENIKSYFTYISVCICFSCISLNAQVDSTSEGSNSPREREFVFEEVNELAEVLEDVLEVDNQNYEWDTSRIEIARRNFTQRVFDTIELNKYKELDQFDYSETRSEDSAFKRWWQRLLRSIFGSMELEESNAEPSTTWSSFINVFKYILILLAAGLIAWFLVKGEFKNLLKKKDKFQLKPSTGDLDITVERDVLLKSLEDSIKNNDFRSAVRYQYLIILKQLNEEDYIQWKDHKLSVDYIKEIKDPDLKKEFSKLTEYFNYAWYGNYSIKRRFLNKAGRYFDSIKSKIS